jgi:hypothetical protein
VAALIGGIVLLIAGGDDSDSNKPSQDQVKQLQDQVLKRTVVDAGAGISVRLPKDWVDTKQNNVISLRSHDRCVAMTLASPDNAPGATRLLDESLTLLRHSYEGVQTRPVSSADVGGIPTKTYTVFGHQGKTQVRILLSAGKGKSRSYLTEVVLSNPSCQGALQRAQIVLGSIQYTK